jgi:nucleoid DNA-binding protein
MTKFELAQHIAKSQRDAFGRTTMTTNKGLMIVYSIMGAIATELKRGKEVRIEDFAIFSRYQAHGRSGTNPRTGATLTIQPKIRVRVKFAKRVWEELQV